MRGTAATPYTASATGATYPTNTLRSGPPATGGTDRYAPDSDRNAGASTAPSSGSTYTPAAPATRYGDRYSDAGATAAGTSRTAGGSAERYPTTGYADSAATAGRYNDTTPPGSNYTPAGSGYVPGSGYAPAGVAPYTSPAGKYAPTEGGHAAPTNTADDPPPYRPGSTSGAGDYVPMRSGSTSTAPGADPGVERASYSKGM
jgi:hypothetical protein